MANIIEIPDGSNNWGEAMRQNLGALNSEIITATSKANSAVNIASLRVRSVNGVFPDDTGNVDVSAVAVDQTARDQAAAAQSTANSKYLKPVAGIPTADLANAVQVTLGKADTAYQKPASGIPQTDLNQFSQDALGRANTAFDRSADLADGGRLAATAKEIADADLNGYTANGWYLGGSNAVNGVGFGRFVLAVSSAGAGYVHQRMLGLTGDILSGEWTRFQTGGPGSAWSGWVKVTDIAGAVDSTARTRANAAVRTVNSTAPDANGNVVVTVSGGGYIKPTNGIPKSDLESAVQTSLGKADTALQSAPVTSVNSKTGSVTLAAADVGAAPTTHTHTADQISDASSSGRTLLTTADAGLARAAINAADAGIAVNAGTGLTGGGNLTANRTLALSSATQASLAKADTISDAGWVALVYNTTTYGSTANPAARLKNGEVRLRGQLNKSTAWTAVTGFASVPTNCIPSQDVVGIATTADAGTARIVVRAGTGAIDLTHIGSTTSTALRFDQVSYFID